VLISTANVEDAPAKELTAVRQVVSPSLFFSLFILRKAIHHHLNEQNLI
jgi:hypothetical protein